MSNVPKLRFKEFSGEWEEKTLDSISTFSKGKGISKSDIDENGQIECIRYGQLYTNYNELIENILSKTNVDKNELVLSEYGDIIIPASGESQVDIATASCVLKKNVALGGDLNIIRTKEDGVFLSYYLNNAKKVDIAKLSQGVSVVHLYSSQLKKLNLNLPSKPEQEKIASFLTSVDTKIEQLTKKESLLQDYKKGVMQKIFNQEIRFKAEDGSEFCEWEEKKLDDTTKSLSSKLYQIKSSEILDDGDYKVIDQGKKTIAGYSNDSKKLFTNGQVIVYGDHTTVVKYIDFDFIIGADGTKLLVNKCDDDLKYLYYNILYNNVEPEGYKRHFSILRNATLQLPCIEEQTKIANFLSSIDKKIEVTKIELEKTKEFKKALLQQMFV